MAGNKKGAEEHNATLIFLEESGFSLKPSVRRTWAPRGQTPILRHRFNWKRLNAIGAIACLPNGSHCDLLLCLQEKSIASDSLILFLENLKQYRAGDPIVLLWDGLPAHRSVKVRDYLQGQSAWLTVERFPAYAPELNPVEYVWSSVKSKHVANLCVDTTVELEAVVTEGARAIGEDEQTLRGCLLASKLYDRSTLVTV